VKESSRQQRGCFITLEGGEGVGKTTNLGFIAKLIRENGNEVLLTREPGGTFFAENIRALLLENRGQDISPYSELLLILAARHDHIMHVIEPALSKGTWVLCDRFLDATYAYQGGGRGIDIETINSLEKVLNVDVMPDCTIYLDAPAELSSKRIADRDLDRIEREGQLFFTRVREVYLERATMNPRIRLVDASRELDLVQEEISKVFSEFLETVE